MKKAKLAKIVSLVLATINSIVSITIAVFIPFARPRFVSIYKAFDIEFEVLPYLTNFLLKTWGNLVFSLFFISVAIFTIIKERSISKKGITLLINFGLLVIIVVISLVYAGSLMMPLFGPYELIEPK